MRMDSCIYSRSKLTRWSSYVHGARQPNRPIHRRRDRRPQHRLGALLSGIDVVAGEDVAPAVLSRPFALITDSIAWAMLMDSGVHEDDAA